MDIRRFLNFFGWDERSYRRISGESSRPELFPQPGMHQPFEDSGETQFTWSDREFLHQMGVSICSETANDGRIDDSKSDCRRADALASVATKAKLPSCKAPDIN